MIEKEFCQLIGSVSRDFRPPFFNDSNPFGPLINRLKYFRMRFRFRRDFRSQSQPHAGKVFDLSLRCVAHRWNHLCFVLHTAEIVSVVCCTSLRSYPRYIAHHGDFFRNLMPLTSRCVAHLGDCLCGVLHTSEIVSVVCCTPRRLSPWCAAFLQ